MITASSRRSALPRAERKRLRRIRVGQWVAGGLFVLISVVAIASGILQDSSRTFGAELLVAWQVHASLVTVAFAGLAVLVQLTSNEVVTAAGVREVLFRLTFFQPLILFSLLGSVQLGLVAIWAPSGVGAILEFCLFLGVTVLMLLASYSYVIAVYVDPQRALRLGQRDLLDRAAASIHANRALAAARAKFGKLIDLDRREIDPDRDVTLVQAPGHVRFSDIESAVVVEAVAQVAKNPTQLVGDADDGATALANPTTLGSTEHLQLTEDLFTAGSNLDRPRLVAQANLADLLKPGDPVFVLRRGDRYVGDAYTLRARLDRAIKWELQDG